MERLTEWVEKAWHSTLVQLSATEFYLQVAVVAVSLVAAWALAKYCNSHVRIFREEPAPGRLYEIRLGLHNVSELLPSVFAALILGIATQVSADLVGGVWLVRAAQGGAFIFLVYSLANHFITNTTIVFILKWIGVPIALLYIADLLHYIIVYLDSVSIDIGNIRISLYAALRAFVFGIVLFWFGRVSNATGQRAIRAREAIDPGTREVIAKLFEIGVFVLIFLLLLNVLGIDLTALAVFGGALGVGLGFGLQQIASNFISGIIILLDRTITIGDYIELEDGRAGTLRELTMRSATLETFDGKDIMVPNERFITTAFTNWTHNNKRQRYPIKFQVGYGTDMDTLFPILREVVASHPKVLSGEDLPMEFRPDAEIAGFGDSGIDILVEFWMEGIDDGENRVGGDLLLMIWTALRAHGIEIPFPQREVRLLRDD
jgi:small-conductance mechanosensitive channel